MKNLARRILSSSLCAVVFMLSPGLGFYEAAAQVVGISINTPIGQGGAAGASLTTRGSFEGPKSGSGDAKTLTGTSLPTPANPTPAPQTKPEPAHVSVDTPKGLPVHPTLPMTALAGPEIQAKDAVPVLLPSVAPASGDSVSMTAPTPSEPFQFKAQNKVSKAFAALRRLFSSKEDVPNHLYPGSGRPDPLPRTRDAALPAQAPSAEGSAPAVSVPGDASAKTGPGLEPAAPNRGPPQAKPEVPGFIGSKTQVFSDPERNKSFWRYFWGNALFTFGFEMYVVGLPYLISSFTKNSLVDHKDQRAQSAEALKAMVRENRSMARIAHWVAQAVSYATIPLFTRNEGQGPRKWLVRSYLIRGGALSLVAGAFFMSGVVGLSTGLGILFTLIAAASFFQGLSVIMEGRMTTQIMGDKSVTDAERTKANAILTFMGAVIAIIGPALAGQISQIKELFGKTGVGGAVIYGLYALATAGAGLIYATINIIKNKAKPSAQASADAPQKTAEKLTFKGALKSMWTSLKEGLRMVWKNRFLRTMMFLGLISSLFADPLIFNVLPEFVENILKANPDAVNGLLGIPVIGWLFKGLTNTPMGYFGLLVAFGSVGSVLATLAINPMKKLFNKLGFKSEESLTIPFYILAALEIPAFWLMIHFPTFWGVLLLYAFQLLVTGFGGMIISGVNQKTVGGYERGQVSKILAAESFVSILAAIVSTYFYGFVLTDIPIEKSLLFAAIATTVYGALRLVSPWFLFKKDQRKRGGEDPK